MPKLYVKQVGFMDWRVFGHGFCTSQACRSEQEAVILMYSCSLRNLMHN